MSLASPDRVRDLLGGAGFTGIEVSPVTTTLRMGQSSREVAEHLTDMGPVRGLLAGAPPETRAAATAALRDAFVPRTTPDGVRLGARIWLVMARRSSGP